MSRHFCYLLIDLYGGKQVPVVNVSNCPSCLQNLGHPSLSSAVTPCRSTSRGGPAELRLVTDEASLSSRRPQSHRDDRHTCLHMHIHRNARSYTTVLEGKLNLHHFHNTCIYLEGVYYIDTLEEKKRHLLLMVIIN